MVFVFGRRQPPSSSAKNKQDVGNGASTSIFNRSTPPPPPLVRIPNRRKSISSLLSPRSERSEPPEELDPLITQNYIVPEHIDAFREALSHDLGQQEYTSHLASQVPASSTWSKLGFATPGVKSPDASSYFTKLPEPTGSHEASNPRRIGRIAAASDFAPIRQKISKRRNSADSSTREGFVYHTLRWPLLFVFFFITYVEFAAYVFVRQIVNLIEYAIAWRGKKGILRKKMRSATTHADWKEAALDQDEFLCYDNWKTEDESGFYDWILIKKVKASLVAFRERGDVENLLGVLDLCIRNNFAGTENFRLYSETYYGTKDLVESYLTEVEASLKFIQDTEKISPETKRQFYRIVSKNLGRSALCLSGGASFGYYHIGVVRALLDSNLLPKIVTGTSAGGLVAALTCTRTDEELKRLLVPALADRITACEEPFSDWGRRAWTTGARFDTVQWAEKSSFFTMGSMTFKEAYERTGKILCISVIPSDRHSPVKLLSYITAPNCVIWSSLLASAAVPGILNPVCLMQKTKNGNIVPWNWGHRFKDGSLRVDIPLQDLHALFNVNYPIVSQVNPHVHLFHFAPKGAPGRPTAHRKGKGWRGGFVLSAAEHVLKLHLKMNFKIIRDLDLLPAILGQDWSSVFLQPFSGAVTIWPKTRAWDWIRLLSDPDRKELARMLSVGQSVTFPKLHMIENRMRLEKAIERGRRTCRRALRAAATAPQPSPSSSSRKGSGTPQPLYEPVATLAASDGGPHQNSMPSDTDNDEVFNPKESNNRITSIQSCDNGEGPSQNGAGGSHVSGDRSSRTGAGAGTGDDPYHSGRSSGQGRPKPYPSYTRYLSDVGRADTDERLKSPTKNKAVWLDRGQQEVDGDDEGLETRDESAVEQSSCNNDDSITDPLLEPGTNVEPEDSSKPAYLFHLHHTHHMSRNTSRTWGNGSLWDDRSISNRNQDMEEREKSSSSSSSSDDSTEDEDI